MSAQTIGTAVTGDVVLPAEVLHAARDIQAAPETSNLPPRALFVGREEELAWLRHELAVDGNMATPPAATVHGVDGIGKSALALAYAHRHRVDYALVWWITADSQAHIEASLADLALRLFSTWAGRASEQERTAWAMNWLQWHPDWLLVFDNVTDARDLSPYVGALSRGHHLATSRQTSGWPGTARALGALTIDDATQLLSSRALGETAPTERQMDDFGELATKLGFLPQALEEAGIFLSQNPATDIGAYRQDLAIRTKSIDDGAPKSAILRVSSGGILLCPLDALDPVIDIGIHLPTRLPDWGDMPRYAARGADNLLDKAIASSKFILIEGNSAAGKSRTGYEALKRNAKFANWSAVLVPESGEALRDLLGSDYDFSNKVIWLDDLERYMGADGLNSGTMRALCHFSGVTIICTMRSRAKNALVSIGSESARTKARKALSLATVVHLDRNLSSAERANAATLRDDPRISGALDRPGGAGFAEYLAAGPASVNRWMGGKNGGNEIGAALISAAIDYRRAGYLAPVPREWLTASYTSYLDSRTIKKIHPQELTEAFAWATEEVEGASSCLYSPDSGATYSAFDYLVDYVQSEEFSEVTPETAITFRAIEGVPDVIWHELADRISFDDPQFMGCVSVASVSLHPALDYAFRSRLAKGKFPRGYFEDPERLMYFARACISVNLCIACQCVSFDVDFGHLVQVAIESLRPLFANFSKSPSSSQIVCLDIFESISSDGNLDEPGTSIYEACQKIPIAEIRGIASILAREGRSDGSEHWLNYLKTRPNAWVQSSIFGIER